MVDSSGNVFKTIDLLNDGKHGDFDADDYVAGNYLKVEKEGFYFLELCVGGVCKKGEVHQGSADEIGKDIIVEIKDMSCLPLFTDHNKKDADRINIVMIGSGYKDIDEFLNVSKFLLAFDGNPLETIPYFFDKDLKKIVTDKQFPTFGMFSIEPFKSNKNKFNIWYLSTQINGSFEIFLDKITSSDQFDYLEFCNLNNVYPAFLVNGVFNPHDDLVPGRSASAKLPNFVSDIKFINKNSIMFGVSRNSVPIIIEEFQIPEWAQVDISNIPNITIVGGSGPQFIHETAHAIFGLQDEYTETMISNRGVMYGYPNCAKDLDEARRWWGAEVGKIDPFYYDYKRIMEDVGSIVNLEEDDIKIGFVKGGCVLEDGKDGVYRPSKNSLMNLMVPVFGSVNRKRAEQILDLFGGN